MDTDTNKNKLSPGRGWACLCHLAFLIGYIIPFGHVLGPFLVWIFKKDEYALVNKNGKEAMNFQITFLLYLLTLIVMGILTAIFLNSMVLTIPILVVGFIVNLIGFIMPLVAAVKTHKGDEYSYPWIFRFIK